MGKSAKSTLVSALRVKLSLRDSERVVGAPTPTGTPKKCKALFGEPLQREPPKSVKHFSGNPYGQDLIVNGSSGTSTPTIFYFPLAPAVLFYRLCKKRAIRESPLPKHNFSLFVIHFSLFISFSGRRGRRPLRARFDCGRDGEGDVCFLNGRFVNRPYENIYLFINGSSRRRSLRNLLPFNKRTVEDAGPYN